MEKQKARTAGVKAAPKKRNREESTQRILKAALEIFSEDGYDAATTKMISQRAGLNEALLHRYFTSKSNLLIEVTHFCFEAIKKEAPYPPAEMPEEEIYNFLINRLKHDVRNQEFLRVIISRLLVDPEVRKEMHKRKDSSLDLFFRERLRLFQKKGLIKPDVDIERLADFVLAQSFVAGFLERIFFEKSIKSCEEQFRVFAKNITKGICPT